MLVTTVNRAKTDEPIEMLFEGQTAVDQKNHVLHEGTHGRHLANTAE